MPRLAPLFAAALLPRRCACCSTPLTPHERDWCGPCAFDWTRCSNKRTDRFSGGLNWAFEWSWLQNGPRRMESALVHRMKYGGLPNLGVHIGEAMAAECPIFHRGSPDKWAMIPIPLHHKKQRQRGFNQSQMLAKGWGDAWKMPLEHALVRPTSGRSLTRLGKSQRLIQTEGLYHPAPKLPDGWESTLHGCVLIDDVITTGATLEAAYSAVRLFWKGPLGFATVLDSNQ